MERLAVSFHQACRGAGIDYALEGDFAVEAYGLPKPAETLHALIVLSPSNVAGFVDDLKKKGFHACASDFQMAFEEPTAVAIRGEDEKDPPIRVRVAITAEERAEVKEALELPAAGDKVRVIRPEQVVAWKLALGTRGDMQEAMVVLMRQQDKLDLNRLRQLTDRMGVTHILEQVLLQPNG